MKKQFPFLEILGGVLGIAATAILMRQRFTIGGPQVFHSDQLIGNTIFTVLLLVPFVATIAAAFTLPVKLRWPMLLSSSLLSLLWLTASRVAQNFPDFPHPHPSGSLFSLSMLLFLPATTVLIIATGLSLRHGAKLSLSKRKAITLGTLSLFTACLLGVSLYVLFLHQGSELWTRAVPNGQWIRVPDIMHPPELATGDLAQELLNAGVVKPLMAWISAGLLALGIFSFAILSRIASQPSSDLDNDYRGNI